MQSKERILVTGAAGFIGYHLSKKLCRQGYLVTGIDNLNDYYDRNLKLARLDDLRKEESFDFEALDLTDLPGLERLFDVKAFDRVVNLAAQAGVRYSITNPHAYLESNLHGFLNILESCEGSSDHHYGTGSYP